MSVSALTWAFAQEIRPATHKFVLVALAHCCNELEDPWRAWPSATDIRKKTNLERRVIFYALKDLRNQGFIKPTGEFKGQIPIYQLNGCMMCTGANSARVHKTTRTSANGASPPSSLPLYPLSTPPTGNKKEQEVISLDDSFISELKKKFPGVNAEVQFRRISQWKLIPKNSKRLVTKRFLVNWFMKADTEVDINNGVQPKRFSNLTKEQKEDIGIYE